MIFERYQISTTNVSKRILYTHERKCVLIYLCMQKYVQVGTISMCTQDAAFNSHKLTESGLYCLRISWHFDTSRSGFLAVSANLSSSLEYQVSAMSAMLLPAAKALHTFAPNWPHQWLHGQDGGSRHSEPVISNSKK